MEGPRGQLVESSKIFALIKLLLQSSFQPKLIKMSCPEMQLDWITIVYRARYCQFINLMQSVEQSCGFNDINQNIFTNHMRSLSCCFLIVCLALFLTLVNEFALFAHLCFCPFPPLITTPDEFVGGQLSRKLIGSWFWNEFVPIPNLLALDSPDTPPQPILSESHIQNKPKLDMG